MHRFGITSQTCNHIFLVLTGRTDWTNCLSQEVLYSIIHELKTWNEAKQSCGNVGAQLATPRNKQQSECIDHMRKETGVWIGIYTEKKRAHYADTGHQLNDTNYSNWRTSTLFQQQKHCVYAGTGNSSAWNMHNCGDSLKAICQTTSEILSASNQVTLCQPETI